MAYDGIVLLALVGVGVGMALWYFLTDTTSHAEEPHTAGVPLRREPQPNCQLRRRRRTERRADDKCAICYELLNTAETFTLPCEHIYHRYCIDIWRMKSGTNPTCPSCRQSF